MQTPNMAGHHSLGAAGNGHEGIVKMLLERKDVNPDQADTRCGRTPLAYPAKSGYEGIVLMLLEREDVNPNQKDTQHRTPLGWAAANGHEEVVKMISRRNDGHRPTRRSIFFAVLELGDINPSPADHGDRASLPPCTPPPGVSSFDANPNNTVITRIIEPSPTIEVVFASKVRHFFCSFVLLLSKG